MICGHTSFKIPIFGAIQQLKPPLRNEFEIATVNRRLWLFSTKGTRAYWGVRYEPGDILVFGSERTGLPGALLESNADRTLTIPMLPNRRSLNVSNAATVALYEALRQVILRPGEGISREGVEGR